MAYRVSAAVAIVVLGFSGPAMAQNPLTKATVTNFRNQVKLLPRNRPARAVKLSDQMTPGDGLATARSARADLRFNDGSLARIGQQVVFRFTAGTRNLTLSNGTMLLLIPPGQGQTQVNTPNAVTGIQGSALFVRYDPVTKKTSVGALTNSGIKVWNRDHTDSRTLKAGQLLVVTQGPLPEPVNFDLQTFYQTSALVEDLRLNEAGVVDSDAAITQVRSETLAGLADQALTAQGQVPNTVILPRPSSLLQDRFFGDRSTAATIRANTLPTATVPTPEATGAQIVIIPVTPVSATSVLQPLKEAKPNPNIVDSESSQLTQPGALQKSIASPETGNSGTSVITNTGIKPVEPVNPPNPTTPLNPGAETKAPVTPVVPVNPPNTPIPPNSGASINVQVTPPVTVNPPDSPIPPNSGVSTNVQVIPSIPANLPNTPTPPNNGANASGQVTAPTVNLPNTPTPPNNGANTNVQVIAPITVNPLNDPNSSVKVPAALP